jgi:hypothetical protein
MGHLLTLLCGDEVAGGNPAASGYLLLSQGGNLLLSQGGALQVH